MKECCRNCEYHWPEEESIFALSQELHGDVCIMCNDNEIKNPRYDPNSKCKEYKKEYPQKNDCCLLCKYYKPTPFDEYEGESATIYSCDNLITDDIYNGTCKKFELWNGVFDIYENK